ncbi:hypothetical protein NDU88_001970 [Pleurodeles waltl]|uniref:Uncharacterized protein n=1 Tax=Pleurodeles waltl TaxID=8319 RepID=A0AAV7T0R8_PLEWA|nr:hypothetical protein NDU88_001969 [Pleurodeles waltl]KAJ1170089.1 hypothetical protein NDU88_001970 [Pleurodeles waltl]
MVMGISQLLKTPKTEGNDGTATGKDLSLCIDIRYTTSPRMPKHRKNASPSLKLLRYFAAPEDLLLTHHLAGSR